MPEATFLHIQTRENASPRVVELAGSTVRIGRGPECDVQIADPSLADVQCQLVRRGASWQVQPFGPSGRISIEGTPVEKPRALSLGMTVRVGNARLTLRGGVALDASLQAFEVPLPAEAEVLLSTNVPPAEPASWLGGSRDGGPDRGKTASPADEVDTEADRLRRWQTRLTARERSLRHRAKELRWEARWRAVGDDLRTRKAPPAQQPPPDATPPARRPRPAPQPLDADTDAGPAFASVVPFPRSSELVDLLPDPEPAGAPLIERFELEPASPDAALEPEPPVEARLDDRAGRPLIVATFELGEEPQVDIEERSGPVETIAPAAESKPAHRAALNPAAPNESEESGDRPPLDGRLPSIRDILSATPARPAPGVPRPRAGRTSSRPTPTLGGPPETWSLPGWLAAPLVVGLVLVLGLAALRLAWIWSSERAAFAGVANLVLAPGPLPPTLPEPPETREPSWWASDSRHLLMSAFLGSSGPPGVAPAADASTLLEAARQVSPLDPAVRLAHLAIGDGSAPLGVSRDALALHQHANRLQQLGKTEAAVAAYGEALAIALRSEAEDAAPEFLDDPRVLRFALPREGRLRDIVRDLLAACRSEPERWLPALPRSPLVALVAFRLLDANRDPAASRARQLVLAPDPPGEPDAVELAARGEAMALDGRLAEAAELYRDALTLGPAESIRRVLAFNLSELEARLGNHAAMVAAWDLARSEDLHDPINLRLAESRIRHTRGRDGALGLATPSRFDEGVRRATYQPGPGAVPRP